MVRGRMAYNFYTPFYPCLRVLKIHRDGAAAGPALRIQRSPHHRLFFALPTSYLGRFIFGFRLKAKPEDEATQVGRWIDEGTEQNRCKKASRAWEAVAKMDEGKPYLRRGTVHCYALRQP